ncbi:hypothetical protein MTR62_10930 [Novosphingobium sp. 1949]|uniref:Uncharacterized protein n=1 Tax=Novosphingobium organovorum TaxID=2930092 RepID=A0ABT0BDQ9_9SPHN|nr:hypothetical protein [Novosphingobium organovorum]MCJ2183202.1 hypothetical protein [Novosphingobium organovorum]
MTIFKKTILAGTLAATAIVSTSPAMARDAYRGHDNTAAVAVGAGILGVALGAIIASSNSDRYYDDGYAYGYGPAYVSGWEWRDGYYWDGDGHRHSRDEYARYARGPQGGERGRGDYAQGGPDRGGDHGGDRGGQHGNDRGGERGGGDRGGDHGGGGRGF